MKIKSSSFLIGAVRPEQYPTTGWAEIALCGRSNVGKSSLINRLIGRRNLARTSGRPGKTQELNYYEIEAEPAPFYLVDLPGYGFAQVSKKDRERWGRFIEAFLFEHKGIVEVWQIVDLRHPPSKDDIAMYEWLTYHQKKVQVIATKADKVPKGRWQAQKDLIRKELGMQEGDIILFSAEKGFGKDILLNRLEQLVTEHLSV